LPVRQQAAQCDVMKKIPAPVFLLALLLAFMTGCTNNGRLISTGLRVELTGIERASDGAVSASWHVVNTNIVAYLLSHVSHKIYLNGTYLGMIVDNEPLGVPANSHTGRTNRLTGGDTTAARVLTEAAASGSANYRVETQITVLIYGDTNEKAALASSGTVPVRIK
jgi:hypothetical protein